MDNLRSGFLLPHLTGQGHRASEIGRIAARLRSLDPARCGVRNVEAYRSAQYVTIVGSRLVSGSPDEMAFMEWTGHTLCDAGYIVRSGGAEGADAAAEQGARRARGTAGIEIVHPYHRPTRGSGDQGNYVLDDPEFKSVCHDLVRGLTENFDRMSEFAQALQARDVAQVAGRDGRTPSTAILFCAKEDQIYDRRTGKGFIGSGTRFAVYTGRLAHDLGWPDIPDFNLRRDRAAYRSAVIDLANRARERLGWESLPLDYGPRHPLYLDLRAEPNHAPLQTDVERQKQPAANAEAQAAARRLLPRVKAHYAALGVTASFTKIRADAAPVVYSPLLRDATVVALGAPDGHFAFIDERSARIRSTDGPIDRLPFAESTLVRVRRNADDLVDVWVVPERQHIAERVGRL